MTAYLVVNFKLTDAEAYKAYVPQVLPTLEAHSAEILAADYHSEALEGAPGHATVIAKFASKEALKAWYGSPEYQKIIAMRTDNSEGIAVAAEGFNFEKTLQALQAL